MTTLSNLARYLSAVAEDGDYLNDWLTHLPHNDTVRDAVLTLGILIARILGN